MSCQQYRLYTADTEISLLKSSIQLSFYGPSFLLFGISSTRTDLPCFHPFWLKSPWSRCQFEDETACCDQVWVCEAVQAEYASDGHSLRDGRMMKTLMSLKMTNLLLNLAVLYDLVLADFCWREKNKCFKIFLATLRNQSWSMIQWYKERFQP